MGDQRYFEKALLGRIPQEDAAHFFVGLKKTAADEIPGVDPESLFNGFQAELQAMPDDPEGALEVTLTNLLSDPAYYAAPVVEEPPPELLQEAPVEAAAPAEEPKEEAKSEEKAAADRLKCALILSGTVKVATPGLDPIQRLQLAAMYSVGAQREEGSPDLGPHAGTGAGIGAAGGAGLGSMLGKRLGGRSGLGTAAGALGGAALGALGGAGVHHVREKAYGEDTRGSMLQAAEQAPRALLESHVSGKPVMVRVGPPGEELTVGELAAGNAETGSPGYFRVKMPEKEAALSRLASAWKKLADGMPVMEEPVASPPPTLESSPLAQRELAEGQEYLQQEQAGMQAQQENEISFMRERLQSAVGELGLKDEQLSTLEQSNQVAEERAAAAEQQALDAEQQAIQAVQKDIDTQNAVQQMRARLLELAAGDPMALQGTQMQTPMQTGVPTMDPSGMPVDPMAQAAPPQAQQGAVPPGGDPAAAAPEAAAPVPATPAQGGEKAANARLIGTLAGAGLGAGLAGLEAAGPLATDLDARRADLEAREQQMKEPGVRNFSKAFSIAKDRALQTLGEATQAHPVAATMTGGLIGASLGRWAGPRIAEGVRGYANTIRESIEHERARAAKEAV